MDAQGNHNKNLFDYWIPFSKADSFHWFKAKWSWIINHRFAFSWESVPCNPLGTNNYINQDSSLQTTESTLLLKQEEIYYKVWDLTEFWEGQNQTYIHSQENCSQNKCPTWDCPIRKLAVIIIYCLPPRMGLDSRPIVTVAQKILLLCVWPSTAHGSRLHSKFCVGVSS